MDHFLEGITLSGHWYNDPNEKCINQYNSSVLYWLALKKKTSVQVLTVDRDMFSFNEVNDWAPTSLIF